MKIAVVGNGLAGTLFSKTLREIDPKADIDIFAEEKYRYYPRPNLIEFLAGSRPIERLFAFPEAWYDNQRIGLHLANPVQSIHPADQRIELKDGTRAGYDYLLLADGAHSFVPPFAGSDKSGLFTLRNLDDAYAILDYLEGRSRAAVIGGGLLGLEIARALNSRGAKVTIVEFFPRLLPRQLDAQGAELLKAQIEEMGIDVRLGLATEEILGRETISGLRFKDGTELKVDTAIVAAGVRANLSLANAAGLKTDKGLIVNDRMQTSDPRIFAAGDSVQHRERLYGIIPASFEQARVAARNVGGRDDTYQGTVFSNSLKIMGLAVTSVGMVNPEDPAVEEFRIVRKSEGVYKKIAVRDGKLVGAIWMGTKQGSDALGRLIAEQKDVSDWKDALLSDDFDFSKI